MPNAIQIDAYGPPEVLRFRAAELAPLGSTEVRVRTSYAAVNHTDLRIRAGDWPISKKPAFPYVPGVEVVGVIDEVGKKVQGWEAGQTVLTMMQGLGGVRAERPGGYADFVTVEADALAAVPPDLEPAEMAALGLVGVTAFEGLRKLGVLKGRRVLVTGAAGGVGSAATAIAQAQGARVVAVVTRAEDAAYVTSLGAEEVIVVDRDDLPDLPSEHFDAVLDVVGGRLFGALVETLRPGGRLSLVGAAGGGEVAFDAWALIRPVTLTGYSTEALQGSALRDAVGALGALLGRGSARVPDYQVLPLADATLAHRLLEQRQVRGRILLQP